MSSPMSLRGISIGKEVPRSAMVLHQRSSKMCFVRTHHQQLQPQLNTLFLDSHSPAYNTHHFLTNPILQSKNKCGYSKFVFLNYKYIYIHPLFFLLINVSLNGFWDALMVKIRNHCYT